MQIAKVSVSGNRAEAGPLEMITAGTIGATVAFEFDETWDGMLKTLVWRGCGRTIDDTTCSGVIPPEVVAEAGDALRVGVYGTKDGKATPTVWVNLGRVMDAADPSGDESAEPSLPVWAQLIDRIGDIDTALDSIIAVQEKLIGGDEV